MTRQVQVWGIAAVGKVIYPDDFVVQLYPPSGGESPASRLARLQWLFNPTDDDGEALPPFIDKETFMKLINEPVAPTVRARLNDLCGTKDHAIAELHAKVGQLTMERDEALRKAGRR